MPAGKPARGLDSFNEIATVRIDLLDTDPPIWRVIEAPTALTLKALHDAIQALMGWFDCHLWEFSDGTCRYGPRMDEDWGDGPRRNAKTVRLRDLCKAGTTELAYVYDFGDNWEMRVAISDIRQGDPDTGYPRYVAGERAGPPEDCGGIPGFYGLLDALENPKHEFHAEAREHLEGYDPHEIDELPIKYALGRIAARRNAARKRLRKA